MDFYKQKDFGELISAPFIFFGKNLKPFVVGLLVFVGPFILTESILIGYFNFIPAKDVITQIQNIGLNKPGNAYFIQFFELFKNFMLYTYICVFVKIYVKNEIENIEMNDIWKEIRRFYWPVAGAQILGGIIIIIGTFLIVIPGIYLAVVLAPLFAIIVFEEKGVLISFSRTFDLIKGNWWLTFGLFIVLFIVLTTVSGVLYLLANTVSGFISSGSAVSVIVNILDLSLELLISTFLILLPVFIYGHLIAEKEQPELSDKINQIFDDKGDTTDEIVQPEENPDKDNGNRFLDETDTDRFKPKD